MFVKTPNVPLEIQKVVSSSHTNFQMGKLNELHLNYSGKLRYFTIFIHREYAIEEILPFRISLRENQSLKDSLKE